MDVDQDENNSVDYALLQESALFRDSVISWRWEKKM